MTNKSAITNFFDLLKNSLNSNLTLPINQFNLGYLQLTNADSPLLLLVPDNGSMEDYTTLSQAKEINANIFIRLTNRPDMTNDLLTMVDEISTFIFDNQSTGGHDFIFLDKWEVDTTDDNTTEGAIAFRIRIQFT